MFDLKTLNKTNKVLLIGNMTLDIIVSGIIESHKGPEKTPILDFRNLENSLGGELIKIYLKLKHEKINSTILTYVGPGKEGDIVIQKAKRNDVKTEFIVFNERYTTTNLKIFNENKILTSLVEKKNKEPMTDSEIKKIEEFVVNLLKDKIDLIIFENKGIFTTFEKSINKICEQNKIKIITI